MNLKKYHIFSWLTALVLSAAFLYSCSPVDLDFDSSPSQGREDSMIRIPVKKYRNVFVVYSMGFNDLYSYLKEDVQDILSSPLMNNRRDIILILSHLANHYPGERYPRYSEGTSPVLTKISRGVDGQIQKDTLLILPEETVAASSQTLREILTYTKENFDAQTYGILMSSHGSGWVPEGYLNDPDRFDSQSNGLIPMMHFQRKLTPVYNMGKEDGEIAVKSMGVHCITQYETREMDLPEIAAAFPFKMDYIIFDACYMGGIEVAYELRNVTDKLIFSQTEILGDGMDYKTMTSYIFATEGPDLVGFCERYFDYYNSKSGQYRSATISMIDCSKLEPLAQSAKDIFARYRTALTRLESSRNVQKYYRSSYSHTQQWFYDFGDIVEKCSPSQEDLDTFNSRLEDAVIYKAATPNFMSSFKIEHHSGLSMYLPITINREYLNSFYRTLEWNQATSLVR